MNGRIYAVLWTWRRHAIVKTKKQGHEMIVRWKEHYQRMGWTIRTNGVDAYIATSPSGEKKAVALHTYDSATKERLFAPPRKKVERRVEGRARPRRGRKPVGV